MFDGQFYPMQPIQFMDGLLAPIIGQNQYKTFFSEYAVGAQPSDWTRRFDLTGWTALVQTSSGSLAGKALRWTKSGSPTRGLLSWDKIPAVADVEILMRSRAITSWSAGNDFAQAIVRGSGVGTAWTFYAGILATSSLNTLYKDYLVKGVAGTATTLGTQPNGPAPNYTVNSWIWSRSRFIGTSLQTRIWHDGASEPGTWDLSQTDSAVTAGGWVGIGNNFLDPNAEIDFFSVALNGDTALGP